VIILSLLHPVKQIPVQVWTFPTESVIRIGRSTDNQVILYSAVVSRRHVELRRVGLEWEVVNLGTNGTYLNGKRITQTNITDGAIIRLARSGPNIQVRMGEAAFHELSETLPASRITHQRADTPMMPTEITGRTPQLDEEIADSEADSEFGLNSETQFSQP
jgi:eukaryotic-like serine/threonine-protein kinase